jgi:hypothetical protein
MLVDPARRATWLPAIVCPSCIRRGICIVTKLAQKRGHRKPLARRRAVAAARPSTPLAKDGEP